jgi:hypothetical protein
MLPLRSEEKVSIEAVVRILVQQDMWFLQLRTKAPCQFLNIIAPIGSFCACSLHVQVHVHSCFTLPMAEPHAK